MSSCGSVTYVDAKELAQILKPLVGKASHHIKSTQDFVEQAKHITLAQGECLSSYDVCPVHLSPSGSCSQPHKGFTGKGPHPQGKDSNGS